MKKAQSISINTIIIAAIGLAVLVVLFAIFTGRIGGFTEGVKNTDTCQQKCSALNLKPTITDSIQCSNQNGQVIAGRYNGVESPNVCCCTP